MVVRRMPVGPIAGLLIALVAGSALVALAGSGTPSRAPSDGEARYLLGLLHARAQEAADEAEFCRPSRLRGTCENEYVRLGGRRAVPPALPNVIGTGTDGGRRVLTICGVDGTGTTYRSRFAVERDGDAVRATIDVYWAPDESAPRPSC